MQPERNFLSKEIYIKKAKAKHMRGTNPYAFSVDFQQLKIDCPAFNIKYIFSCCFHYFIRNHLLFEK